MRKYYFSKTLMAIDLMAKCGYTLATARKYVSEADIDVAAVRLWGQSADGGEVGVAPLDLGVVEMLVTPPGFFTLIAEREARRASAEE